MTSQHPAAPLAELLAHREWVRRVARVLVRDESGADDLEQEVWRKAVERPPRDARSPLAWLGTVLRSTAADLRRAASRRTRHEAAAARPERVTPTDVVAATETHERVVRAVLALDEPYRTTMLLRWFEDLAPVEIARRQGVPLETVRTRLRRGVATLRAELCTKDERRAIVALAALAPGSLRGIVTGAAAPAAGGVAVGTTSKIAVAAALIALVAAGLVTRSVVDDAGESATADVEAQDGEASSPRIGTSSAGRGAGDDWHSRTSRPRAAPPSEEQPPSAPPRADAAAIPPRAAATAAAGATRVAGRVVDETGRPVADARIEMMDAHPTIPGGGSWRVLRTDADGRFAADGLKIERTTVRVYAPGFCFSSTDAPRGTVDLAVALVRGGAIHGIVVDRATGAGIAGATVAMNPVAAASHDPATSATTGADGRFRAEGLRDAPHRITVGFRVSEGLPAEYVPLVRESVPLSEADLRLELDRGLAIAGVVIDRVGAPTATSVNVEAIALGEHGGGDFLRGRVVKVPGAGDGRFRIPGLAPGGYDLKATRADADTVQRGGAAASVVWVRGVTAGASDVRTALGGGRTLRGTIVDDRGEPVLADGTLFVFPAGSATSDMSLSITVNASAGRFESPELPGDGAWDVYAMYFQGHGRTTVRGVRSADEPLRVVMRRSVRITGRVVDESGKPVPAGVPVYVRAEDAEPLREGATTVTQTDASGAFAAEGLGDFTFGLLAGGGTSPYAGGPPSRGVKAGRPDVTLTVRAGVTLSGRLVDADGRPFRTHHLMARPPSADGSHDGAPAWTRVDDEDGRFSLRGLPRGPVTLGCYRGEQFVQLGEFTAPAEDVIVRLPTK